MFEIGVPRVDADGEPVLDDEDNPVLDRIWTRDGSFRLTVLPDDPVNVYLTTQHGRLVRDINDEPIAIPRNNRIEIDGNGNIIAHDDDNPLAAPLPVGQMKIVRVMRPQMLESIGENQFRLAGGLDDPEGILEVVDLNFREDETEGIHVRQGFIEQSNVDLSEEMTELIASQRALQFSARALASADTMMELTNRLRG